MKNWPVGKRIGFGFAAVLGLFAALAVVAMVLLGRIRTSDHALVGDALPGLMSSAKATELASAIQLAVVRHIIAKTAEDKKGFEDQVSQAMEIIKREMADYEKNIVRAEDRQNFNNLQDAWQNYLLAYGPVLEISNAGTTNASKAAEALELNALRLGPLHATFLKTCSGLRDDNGHYAFKCATVIRAAVNQGSLLIVSLGIGGIIFGVFFAGFLVRATLRALTSIAAILQEGANQVASAASQVSSSSQSLAAGASEQAAAVEQTSSSLEEMSAMTKHNAENARQANDLAKQARTAADKGAADMQTMSAAMEAIRASSDDIAKIIKTIDEIAFQTNILALNAAVEAARAGEAGMGFAVVADEVRNLAQRSAQAANETAVKIEGAIHRTAQGVEISRKVGQTLGEIVSKARQMDELAAEVASASGEQTQGITQINTAVGQVDKVTQGSAASAEQIAAAAEELNAQARTMRQSVAELLQLVGGQNQTPTGNSVAAARSAAVVNASAADEKPAVSLNGNRQSRPAATLTSVANRRTQLPLEADFKDFEPGPALES